LVAVELGQVVPWLVLWPLIPIGVPVGLAAVILIAIVGLLIVVAGAVIWMLGYVLVGLGWSEAEALMGAGGGDRARNVPGARADERDREGPDCVKAVGALGCTC
jgi:hypothetical protein